MPINRDATTHQKTNVFQLDFKNTFAEQNTVNLTLSEDISFLSLLYEKE